MTSPAGHQPRRPGPDRSDPASTGSGPSPCGAELDPADPLDDLLLKGMRARSRLVAIGVWAHVVDHPDHIEVRAVLAAHPRKPGAVGRWLDSLPADRTVVVPSVVSPRLRGMLERRGYRLEDWYDPALRLEATAMTRFIAFVGSGISLVEADDVAHARWHIAKRLGYEHKPWIAERINVRQATIEEIDRATAQGTKVAKAAKRPDE